MADEDALKVLQVDLSALKPSLLPFLPASASSSPAPSRPRSAVPTRRRSADDFRRAPFAHERQLRVPSRAGAPTPTLRPDTPDADMQVSGISVSAATSRLPSRCASPCPPASFAPSPAPTPFAAELRRSPVGAKEGGRQSSRSTPRRGSAAVRANLRRLSNSSAQESLGSEGPSSPPELQIECSSYAPRRRSVCLEGYGDIACVARALRCAGSGETALQVTDENARRNLERIVDLFRNWDADGDGVISRAELKLVMDFATDGAVLDADLDRLMDVADTNKSGCIELDEFARWTCSPQSGMFSGDIMPSRIAAVNNPIISELVHELFTLHDVSRNGFISYDDFAMTRMVLSEFVDTCDIEEEFWWLDRDQIGQVTWLVFSSEVCRLLDAIPRPIEDKVALLRNKVSRLSSALLSHRQGKGIILTTGEFVEKLRSKFRSDEKAFEALSSIRRGILDASAFQSDAERLLSGAVQARVALPCARRLLRDLDAVHDASGLAKLAPPVPGARRHSARGTNVLRRLSLRRGGGGVPIPA
eukprot:TRINITY_DN74831_c0_g1_i1.p1 TRINITY_DN74831_c0_g1~~TRINITY_DN74831_c0_g1_i1.p1  ORF type:complete len:532 (-),score=85.90 TRINITY_DN74831_c0_g1_i1:304-1899(-)